MEPTGARKARRLLFRRKSAVVAGAVVVGVVVVIGTGWWLLAGRSNRAGGFDLGRLPPGVRPNDLNVVVVTLDTTRADRIGAYGARDVETPVVDRLAREGVLFEQAESVTPLTLPAHSSIFTGKFPPEHGVRDNGGFFVEAKTTTLAERMKEGGWATGAFIGAWVLDSRWGLDQGFDVYSDRFDLSKYKVVNLGTVQKKGDEVMDLALAWLEGVKARKFFACSIHGKALSTTSLPGR